MSAKSVTASRGLAVVGAGADGPPEAGQEGVEIDIVDQKDFFLGIFCIKFFLFIIILQDVTSYIHKRFFYHLNCS